ncbi:MAG: glycoside hydrolase family 16 protein [Bacteroidales bacterium]|jgi:beta-glucanase (GH16 family)|nr:glycoside hydrolase family 16 protein [Bacteroidales bacterium]
MKAEQQYYSDDNVLKNKNIYNFDIKKEHIFAKPQWDKPEMDFDYTSGMLWSNKQFLYGSFEAEIYIPEGYGLWSAFWLFGRAKNPKRFGEIDIFEYYGKESKFTYNTHFGVDYEHNQSKGAHGIKIPKLENSWHKYRLDWFKNKKLRIYIDNKLVGIRSSEGINLPMNLIINMAIKKNIGTNLDKYLPTRMSVRNIKYYK